MATDPCAMLLRSSIVGEEEEERERLLITIFFSVFSLSCFLMEQAHKLKSEAAKAPRATRKNNLVQLPGCKDATMNQKT